MREYNAAVRTDVPFNHAVRDGRCTVGIEPPKSNWANALDTPPFEAYGVTCGITFTFGGLRINHETGQVLDLGYQPDPGPLRRGRDGGRDLLFQLPGGHGPGLRPRVRPDRRQRGCCGRAGRMSAAVSPMPARGGARPVDTHAHWYPQEFIALLDRKAAANGGRMERDEKGVPVFSLPGVQPVSRMPPLMVEPELILKEMDQRGIETYVLSLTNPMVYWAPPAFGLELAQTWNDISSAVCVKHPDRFVGTIQLPMQAPEVAVRELERAARLAGLRAVYMATHVNGRNLDDKAFWPVYERCEGLGLPIFLHPLYPCGGDRIAKHFMRNLCGNPYENGLAAASLVLGGVMDAFPGLVVMLPQAGGIFPWLIGRFDRGVEVRKELAHMTQPPSAFLRRFYYDTVSHHPLIMKFLTELVGADRVVLGSDYNQDMGCERPVEFVEKIPGLTERERNLILRENAARLLRL